MKNVTTLSPLPQEQVKKWSCRMLHTRIPKWDGTYRYDKLMKRKVPNIEWVCKEGCDGKGQ